MVQKLLNQRSMFLRLVARPFVPGTSDWLSSTLDRDFDVGYDSFKLDISKKVTSAPQREAPSKTIALNNSNPLNNSLV